MVVRHLRNAPFKVAEKLETSVINQSQSFKSNWYESVWLHQLPVLDCLSAAALVGTPDDPDGCHWQCVSDHVPSYAADMVDSVEKHGVKFHGYADDFQLCVHCRPNDTAVATAKLESCVSDVDDLMSANRLKLNTEKTELLWTGTHHNVSTWYESGPSLQLNATTVNASSHVRVLGVHFSSDLSLDRHVSKSTPHVFISFVDYDASDVHSMLN